MIRATVVASLPHSEPCQGQPRVAHADAAAGAPAAEPLRRNTRSKRLARSSDIVLRRILSTDGSFSRTDDPARLTPGLFAGDALLAWLRLDAWRDGKGGCSQHEQQIVAVASLTAVMNRP